MNFVPVLIRDKTLVKLAVLGCVFLVFWQGVCKHPLLQGVSNQANISLSPFMMSNTAAVVIVARVTSILLKDEISL